MLSNESLLRIRALVDRGIWLATHDEKPVNREDRWPARTGALAGILALIGRELNQAERRAAEDARECDRAG